MISRTIQEHDTKSVLNIFKLETYDCLNFEKLQVISGGITKNGIFYEGIFEIYCSDYEINTLDYCFIDVKVRQIDKDNYFEQIIKYNDRTVIFYPKNNQDYPTEIFIKYDNGCKYHGIGIRKENYLNNKFYPHGYGKMTYLGGNFIEGEFKNGALTSNIKMQTDIY